MEGFDQYYFNSAGERAFFAAEALERIGALQMAAIVREANAHFGPEGPSRDREPRVRRLLEITADDEDLFDVLDRRFYGYGPDVPVASPRSTSISLADSLQSWKVPKLQVPDEQVHGVDRWSLMN